MAINVSHMRLSDLVLKPSMVNMINYTMDASVKTSKAFPHTIITGPPGTGKTSLAQTIVAEYRKRCGSSIKCFVINAASLSRGSDLLFESILDLRKGGIIVIDEIHALSKQVCETLYTLFDYNKLHTIGGDLKIDNLTIIGCTTDPQKVPAPLMDRLTFKLRLGNYTNDDLVNIMTTRLNGINYTNEALSLIANISRGVPRIAIQNLTNMNNYAIAMDLIAMDRTQVIESLALMGMDEHGLTEEDKTVIQIIFENQPASLTLITSMLNMDPLVYQENIEVPLISKGYIAKTPKGRVTTQKSIDMLYGE